MYEGLEGEEQIEYLCPPEQIRVSKSASSFIELILLPSSNSCFVSLLEWICTLHKAISKDDCCTIKLKFGFGLFVRAVSFSIFTYKPEGYIMKPRL